MKQRNILLMPDPAEGMDNVDPLDVYLDDIDTSRPVLPGTWYRFQIGDCKIDNSEEYGRSLQIPLRTTEEVQALGGQTVKSGTAILSLFISLDPFERPSPTGKGMWTNTITDIKINLARVTQGLGLKVKGSELINNPSLLNGGFLERVKLKVLPENQAKSERNVVAEIAKAV